MASGGDGGGGTEVRGGFQGEDVGLAADGGDCEGVADVEGCVVAWFGFNELRSEATELELFT